MHDFFEKEPDPLDGLLTPPPLPNDLAPLRRDLLGRTTRALFRRRRLRLLAIAAGLAACYVAGLLTMRGALSPTPPEVVQRPASPPAPQTVEPVAAEPEDPALALEWRALDSDSRDQRRALYRQAADRYLSEENDPQSALRCYGNALNTGTAADLAVSSEDSWLLMAIKVARQKEKDHAKSGG